MKLKKLLTTTETTRAVAAAPEPTPPARRGPAVGDPQGPLPGGLTPFTFCVKYALADEWAAFQKTVQARVDSEPKEVWWACDKCGKAYPRAFRATPGGYCISCNFRNYEDGGRMVKMTPAAVTKYKAAEAVRMAEAVERDVRAALWAENQERGKAGLRPWTRDEFKARQKTRAQSVIGTSMAKAKGA